MLRLRTIIENINNQEKLSKLRKRYRQIYNLLVGAGNNTSEEDRIKIRQEMSDIYNEIQNILSVDPHEIDKEKFILSQYTGGISDSAYEDYKKDGGLSWLGSPSKFPILLSKEQFGPYMAEFRQRNEDSKYVSYDDKHNVKRDEKGNAIYLSKDEIIAKNLPLKDTLIVAFIDGMPRGFASNEFGAVGVWVEDAFQGYGIGTSLLEKHIEQRPDVKVKKAKIGQMTSSGKGMTGAYYDLMTKKHGKNWWYHLSESTLKNTISLRQIIENNINDDVVYHITKKSNINNIKNLGLIPSIPNDIPHEEKAIFLFKSKLEAEDAFMNWYSDRYDEYEEFCLLTINSKNLRLFSSPWEFEYICYEPIPKENIIKIEEI